MLPNIPLIYEYIKGIRMLLDVSTRAIEKQKADTTIDFVVAIT